MEHGHQQQINILFMLLMRIYTYVFTFYKYTVFLPSNDWTSKTHQKLGVFLWLITPIYSYPCRVVRWYTTRIAWPIVVIVNYTNYIGTVQKLTYGQKVPFFLNIHMYTCPFCSFTTYHRWKYQPFVFMVSLDFLLPLLVIVTTIKQH